MNQQPAIQAGIMSAPEICFELNGEYAISNTQYPISNIYFGAGNHPGVFRATLQGEEMVLSGEGGTKMTGRSFTFRSASPSDFFLLRDVTIGIDFHWEQKEDQRFRGDLKLIQEEGKVRAINMVPLEEYLRSVISSEMSAASSPELLKAHAVISRSWLLAQIEKSRRQKVWP